MNPIIPIATITLYFLLKSKKIRNSDHSQVKTQMNTSISKISIAVIIGIGATWILLPGIFDSKSNSIFSSENRRSPILLLIGKQTIVDKSMSLNEDYFGGPSFELNHPSNVTITITHETGPSFEVYFVDKEGYDDYNIAVNSFFGDKFHYFPELSGIVQRNSSFRKSGKVKAGHYVLLMDNTDNGNVSPPMNFSNDVINANVKIVVE